MSLLVGEMIRLWPYVVGGLGFVAALVTVLVKWQSLIKGSVDIKKGKLELKDKQREELKRHQRELEASGLRFDDIKIERSNDQWREVPLSELDARQQQGIEKARSILNGNDATKDLRFFELDGAFFSATPSFEVIVKNPTEEDILMTDMGIRGIYVAAVEQDVGESGWGGGEPSSSYKVALSETYEIDASRIFADLGKGYGSDWDGSDRDDPYGFYWWTEWKTDKRLRVAALA